MRIEDHRAHRLVLGDDLVQPLFCREAHQWQAREPDPAVEADDLEMAPDLVPIMFVDPLDHASAPSLGYRA